MKQFDILKYRNYGFLFSTVLIVGMLIVFFIQGVKLDISFQGGTRMTLETTAAVNAEDAANLAKQVTGREINGSITKSYASEGENRQVEMLRLDVAGSEPLSEEEVTKVRDAVAAQFPVKLDSSKNETLSIAPSIGRETLERGVLAVVISSLLILLYVGLRFAIMAGFSAGFTAVLALIHDSLIIFGVYVVFRLPLNDGFIAAVLTIIGFSVNDTIIMYDRIRENTTLMRKHSRYDIINTSVKQTLSRSIYTTVTVLACLFIMAIFASVYNIGSLKDFSISLTAGMVSGTYSSLFIAVPLYYMIRESAGKKKSQPAQ
mgnify:CR=1 FL=1